MKKRGQTAIFTIIGIVIVLLGLGFLFFKEIEIGGLKPTSIEVPAQAEIIKEYIENCINNLLDTVIIKLSSQGGYISLPNDPINVGEFSNTLTLYGNNKVAIWNYIADNNIMFNQKPTLESMKNEISNYITNNLRSCLGEFKTFNDFSVKSGRIKTEADIQDKKIITKVTFPVEIKKSDFEFKFNEFYSTKKSPLKELFINAEKIFETEEKELFLEKRTLNMMSVYKEIPFVGETNDCIAPIWIKDKVIEDFKNILKTNVQAYKIKGTNYTLTREKDKYLEIDANINDKDLISQLMFSELWPFELSVIPDDNGILRGYSITEALGELRGIAEGFVCLSTHEFIYTIKYPVLVILNKDDLSFQFAMMSFIDRNEPRENKEEFASFEQYDQRFCNEQIKFIVDTVDQDFKNLDNVEIKYKCINHLCDLGESKDGIWQGKAPLCINGQFIGNKKGYHIGKSQISTNQEGSALLVLEKLRTIPVEVLIVREGSGELKEGEKAHIILNEEFKEFSKFVLYPEQKSVDLIPGFYKAKVYLISQQRNGIKIPEKKFTTCYRIPKGTLSSIFGATEEKCELVTIPGTTINQIVTGTDEFTFTITEQNLRAKKIRFWAPWHGIIGDISELANLTKQPARQPEFL